MTKKNNHFDICIIGGLGHVGLPLGIYLSEKKLKVCCYDNNKLLLEKVEKGFMPYIEKNSENLLKKNIKMVLGTLFLVNLLNSFEMGYV